MGMVLLFFGVGGLVGLGLLIAGVIKKNKILMGLGAAIVGYLAWVLLFG